MWGGEANVAVVTKQAEKWQRFRADVFSGNEEAHGNKRPRLIAMSQLFYATSTVHLNYFEQRTGRESATFFPSVSSVTATFCCSRSHLRHISAKDCMSFLGISRAYQHLKPIYPGNVCYMHAHQCFYSTFCINYCVPLGHVYKIVTWINIQLIPFSIYIIFVCVSSPNIIISIQKD